MESMCFTKHLSTYKVQHSPNEAWSSKKHSQDFLKSSGVHLVKASNILIQDMGTLLLCDLKMIFIVLQVISQFKSQVKAKL